jgi:hypothetical protein
MPLVAESNYVRRVVDDELDELLSGLPAILLDGPKGVGKTETARRRSRTIRRLDVAAEKELVEADPSIVASDEPPVLLDEWQRCPGLWDAVRHMVDADGSAGRFLLTGSPPGSGMHSGAGRIASVRMRPFTLSERGVGDPTVSFRALAGGRRPNIRGRTAVTLPVYVDEILAGGFPGMRHLAGRSLVTQLDGYLERIVDHDLSEAGFTVRRPAAVRSWLRAYAAAIGTTASWEKIRDAATSELASKPSRPTTSTYTELLTSMRILDPLEAWSPTYNHLARLTSAPKHYLADPALAARLLHRTRHRLLSGDETGLPIPRDGTFLGALFESLVALSVRTLAQGVAGRAYHLRTEHGRHEIDFIVETDHGIVAVESKLNPAVNEHDVRHLSWLSEILGAELLDAVVITAGPEAYRRRDGVAVVPLALLGP